MAYATTWSKIPWCYVANSRGEAAVCLDLIQAARSMHGLQYYSLELLKMLASLSATKRKTHASAGDLTKVEVSLGGQHGGQGVQGLGGKAGLGRSSDALPRAL